MNNIIKCWYIGSMVFFFEHIIDGAAQFLILVELAKVNAVAKHDNFIPVVELFNSEYKSYAVIRFEDIICSVGLLKTDKANTFSVISRHIFKESLSTNRSEERRVGKECRSRWSPY